MAQLKDRNEEWEELGTVAIDSGLLLLVDALTRGATNVPEMGRRHHAQVRLSDRRGTGVVVGTGMGDGGYVVEGRYADCLLGRRIAEIRVVFFDADEGAGG